MIRYLLYAFLIYATYRLIFNFIIPVYRATRKAKEQFKDMHGKMQDFMQQQQKAQEQSSVPQKEKSQEKSGDYIDFEEVK